LTDINRHGLAAIQFPRGGVPLVTIGALMWLRPEWLMFS
jgi:hypothetical protein